MAKGHLDFLERAVVEHAAIDHADAENLGFRPLVDQGDFSRAITPLENNTGWRDQQISRRKRDLRRRGDQQGGKNQSAGAACNPQMAPDRSDLG